MIIHKESARAEWREEIEKRAARDNIDVSFDHPIIDLFRAFMVSPVALLEYGENDVEAIEAKTRRLYEDNALNASHINPETDVLFMVVRDHLGYRIRYASASKPVPLKDN